MAFMACAAGAPQARVSALHFSLALAGGVLVSAAAAVRITPVPGARVVAGAQNCEIQLDSGSVHMVSGTPPPPFLFVLHTCAVAANVHM